MTAPQSLRLAELAERVDGEVRGDGDRPVAGVRALPEAGPEHLSVLSHPGYRERARASAAGALLVPRGEDGEPRLGGDLGRDLLLVENPSLALVRLLELFHPPARPAAGVHPTAVVGEDVELPASVHVGPYAVIGAGSSLGEETVVESHAVIGPDCRLGADCWLHPHAVLYPGTILGDRVRVHSGAVLGADGFGYVPVEGAHLKVPQVGRVEVEDDVEIGALSAADRATLGATRLGRGTKVDNLVQVGHNVEVGPACLLCGQVGIGGSSRLGAGVVMGGRSGVADHLEVGDGVQVAGTGVVMGRVAPGSTVGGIPARDLREWHRQTARVARLDVMARRLREMEKRLAALEAPAPGEEDGT